MRQRIAYALLRRPSSSRRWGSPHPDRGASTSGGRQSATLAARVAAEQELGVRAVMSREERTWSYELT